MAAKTVNTRGLPKTEEGLSDSSCCCDPVRTIPLLSDTYELDEHNDPWQPHDQKIPAILDMETSRHALSSALPHHHAVYKQTQPLTVRFNVKLKLPPSLNIPPLEEEKGEEQEEEEEEEEKEEQEQQEAQQESTGDYQPVTLLLKEYISSNLKLGSDNDDDHDGDKDGDETPSVAKGDERFDQEKYALFLTDAVLQSATSTFASAVGVSTNVSALPLWTCSGDSSSLSAEYIKYQARVSNQLSRGLVAMVSERSPLYEPKPLFCMSARNRYDVYTFGGLQRPIHTANGHGDPWSTIEQSLSRGLLSLSRPDAPQGLEAYEMQTPNDKQSLMAPRNHVWTRADGAHWTLVPVGHALYDRLISWQLVAQGASYQEHLTHIQKQQEEQQQQQQQQQQQPQPQQ